MNCYQIGIVILLTIIILSYYRTYDSKKSKFLLYSPTCGGINREECLGLTSGNMPVIDATSYDWFRSAVQCDGSLGIPPSY